MSITMYNVHTILYILYVRCTLYIVIDIHPCEHAMYIHYIKIQFYMDIYYFLQRCKKAVTKV